MFDKEWMLASVNSLIKVIKLSKEVLSRSPDLLPETPFSESVRIRELINRIATLRLLFKLGRAYVLDVTICFFCFALSFADNILAVR